MFSKKKLAQTLSLRLLEITMPQKTGDESNEHESLSEIKYSEQLFSALLSMKAPFVFEIAVHNIGSEIHFYVAVPKEKVSFATQQILGLFPHAQVQEAHEYTIFGPGSHVAGGTLSMKGKSLVPIRSYMEAEVDTFGPILSTFAKLQELGDGAALQILVEPATGSFSGSVRKAIGRVRKGESLSTIQSENALTEIGKFVESFFGSSSTKKEEEHDAPLIDDTAVAALEKKISKPLLSVETRIVVAASSAEGAESALQDIAGSFGQFSGPMRAELVLQEEKSLKNLMYKYAFREAGKNSMTLNTEELASFFHLPTHTTDIPRVTHSARKEVTSPSAMSHEGVLLGETTFRGDTHEVRVSEDDRRRHVYMVGQTGTGKSTLIKSMASQDIAENRGVCIIDPNGDLVDDVLGLVPMNRIDDVIVFDPSQIGQPLGLNMLEYDLDKPEQKTFIVNEMQSIFNRLFSEETMGPMFEQYMRNALLLLMEDAKNEPATLTEIPRIFTDTAWRNAKLSRINNQLVVNFWREEAEKAGGEGSLANITPYITSKFGNFIANDFIRPIVGQEKSAFDFRKVMDEGKILLVKLPKGKIGDINANLLGMIITGKLLMAALGRDDVEQEARRDFYLYIDEFQNFTTDSIATILSEARKYRLNLTMAHQYLSQLTDSIKGAVFGNVGTLISFRVGSDDAKALEPHMAPNFASTDLISIENLYAIIRPLVNGQPTRAFNMRLRLPQRGNPAIAEKLTELSRLTYGSTLAEVEEGISRRLS